MAYMQYLKFNNRGLAPSLKGIQRKEIMEMKKFEIGKTYIDSLGCEVKVVSRTEKTITFVSDDKFSLLKLGKRYTRKVQNYHKDYETVEFISRWDDPVVFAINEKEA